jgi:hypothetical protein
VKTYFIYSEATQHFKVGRSLDPHKRLANLQTAHPAKLTMLGFLEGDHEQTLHHELAAYRTCGEWFVWNQHSRRIVHDHLSGRLPAVRSLRVNQNVTENDWILEAEQIVGGRISLPDERLETGAAYDLCFEAACELEGAVMEEFKQQLIECDFESLEDLYLPQTKSSEEWAYQMLDIDGTSPLTECEEALMQKYLIGTHISERQTTRLDMFWHEPLTEGGRSALRNYLFNVVEWTGDYQKVEFQGWVWNCKQNRFELWAQDLNLHLNPPRNPRGPYGELTEATS